MSEQLYQATWGDFDVDEKRLIEEGVKFFVFYECSLNIPDRFWEPSIVPFGEDDPRFAEAFAAVLRGEAYIHE